MISIWRKCALSRVACLVLLLIFLGSLSGCEGFFVEPKLVSISISPPSPSMITSSTQQFSAVGTYDDGSTKVLGDGSWSSSNATVVFINQQTGMATAVNTGTATISCSYDVAVGSTNVTVLESPLTSLQVNPLNPRISLATTNTQQFSAVAVFADGTTRDITSSVTWTSSETTVATISNTGLATASAKMGTSTITASSGTIKSSTTLTVVP